MPRISSSLELEPTLQSITDSAAALSDAPTGALCLINDDDEFNAVAAHGVAMVTGKAWFSVRQEQKQRGREQGIEGTRPKTGPRVLPVDEVSSTGGSTVKADDRLTAGGVAAARPANPGQPGS